MKSISLYEEKNSFLNRLSPESKILYVLSAVFIPIFMGNHMASTGFILLSGVIRKTIPILGVSGFVVLTVLLIQGLFRAGNETALFGIWGLTFYKEGLMFALDIAINVFNIILCFCVLVLCTKPSDMIENFVRRGFSPRFGYVFISADDGKNGNHYGCPEKQGNGNRGEPSGEDEGISSSDFTSYYELFYRYKGAGHCA